MESIWKTNKTLLETWVDKKLDHPVQVKFCVINSKFSQTNTCTKHQHTSFISQYDDRSFCTFFIKWNCSESIILYLFISVLDDIFCPN
jgi:hypothetical protein